MCGLCPEVTRSVVTSLTPPRVSQFVSDDTELWASPMMQLGIMFLSIRMVMTLKLCDYDYQSNCFTLSSGWLSAALLHCGMDQTCVMWVRSVLSWNTIMLMRDLCLYLWIVANCPVFIQQGIITEDGIILRDPLHHKLHTLMFPPFSQPGCPLDLNLHSVFTASCLTLDTIMEREWRMESRGCIFRDTDFAKYGCVYIPLFYICCRDVRLSSIHQAVLTRRQSDTLWASGPHCVTCRDNDYFFITIKILWIIYTTMLGFEINHIFSLFVWVVRKVFLYIGGFYWRLRFCAGSRFWGQQEKSPLLIFNGGPWSIGFFIVPPGHLLQKIRGTRKRRIHRSFFKSWGFYWLGKN